jgi:uncharacterized protein YjbI with pentapeptide repeats
VANPEHLAKLKEGVNAWNAWRSETPQLIPNLIDADLSGAKLFGVDLSDASLSGASLGYADLRVANLSGAKLSNAKLHGANLSSANLNGTTLSGAKLIDAQLIDAKLRGARLIDADLTHANLSNADLRRANLFEANLTNAYLIDANLFEANLSKSKLEATYFQAAKLQCANLDGAILTNATLWETLRASWSIKGVVCERAYWDEHAQSPTEYAPGEFEHLYSEQTTIELHYHGGLSTFELSTLPALLQRLTSQHPNASIRLKTLEETGGGSRIVLCIEQASPEEQESIQQHAKKLQELLRNYETGQRMIESKDRELLKLQGAIEAKNEIIDKFFNKLEGNPTLIFHGEIKGGVFLQGDHATSHQQTTFNSDPTLILALFDKLLTHNSEFTATETAEVEAAKAEFQKPNPDKPRLKRLYEFLQKLPAEAVLKGVDKLVDGVAKTDWESLLRHFGNYLHNLPWH